MLHAQDIAKNFASFFILILSRYITNQAIMIALTDFMIENDKTGNATPEIFHTLKKFTFSSFSSSYD